MQYKYDASYLIPLGKKNNPMSSSLGFDESHILGPTFDLESFITSTDICKDLDKFHTLSLDLVDMPNQ
jgi:hypothetical protein